MNILVLCTGNSARSILLEALLNDLGAGGLRAYSAGSQPAGRVHPHSLKTLAQRGHGVDGYHSKSWDVFGAADAPVMDVVITVCGSAAAETCPIWPGTPLRAHWGVEDPAAITGDAAPAAFEQAYAVLRKRALTFLAQDVETMSPDKLRAHLAACGEVM